MLLRRYAYGPSLLMKIGLVALILGPLSLRFGARLPGMNPDRADGMAGFLYGLAIASLLLSVRARRRRTDA